MSIQLHVDINIKYIQNHFPLLETIIIENTFIRVKNLDLYNIETEYNFFLVFFYFQV